MTANKRQVQNMEENGMTAGEVLNIWDEITRRGWTAEEILDFIRKVASK